MSFQGIDANARNVHRCLQDKSVAHLKACLVVLFDDARHKVGDDPDQNWLYINAGVCDSNTIWAYLKSVLTPAFSIFHLVYLYEGLRLRSPQECTTAQPSQCDDGRAVDQMSYSLGHNKGSFTIRVRPNWTQDDLAWTQDDEELILMYGNFSAGAFRYFGLPNV